MIGLPLPRRRRPPLVTGGWSRTVLPVSPEMLVVDIGSGAHPNVRADILVDRDLTDDRHRAGSALVRDGRPLVCADVSALPFRSGSVDFVIVSHLAEHVEDPAAMCRELSRVAVAGYLETPSPLCDVLLHEDYHLWRVGASGDVLEFVAKGRSRRFARPADWFYRWYNAAQLSCERPTATLPPGPAGRVLGLAITAVGAALNRSGFMHTRLLFAPNRPLRFRVVQPPSPPDA